MADYKAQKTFKDFEVLIKIDDDNKKRLWMRVANKKTYQSESWFVNPPSFFERLFKITWQDKIKDMEQKLFKKLLNRVQGKDNLEIRTEIEKWEKGAENV